MHELPARESIVWHLFIALVFLGADTKSSPTTEEPAFDIPYLGAEEVIDEVILLLARLENDRRETMDAFKKEEKRLSELENKIDGLAEQRMAELPRAVQLGIEY